MNTKKVFVAAILLFWGLSIMAQVDTNLSFHPKPYDYSFETGVSFSKFGKNTSGFTKYISPMTSYSVNENLNLTFGATLAQSTFNFNTKSAENDIVNSMDFNSNRLFSGADLRLSPRISVGGNFFYEYNVIQPTGKDEVLNDFDSKGMELNLNYHINENSHFNFSVGVSEGVNYYDPFHHNNDFSHNGFQNNSFNSFQSPFNTQRNIFE